MDKRFTKPLGLKREDIEAIATMEGWKKDQTTEFDVFHSRRKHGIDIFRGGKMTDLLDALAKAEYDFWKADNALGRAFGLAFVRGWDACFRAWDKYIRAEKKYIRAVEAYMEEK
jgi:hypothetical protein